MRERFGEAWDLLFHPPVAHRGLWSAQGAPENSLAAFEGAAHAGYGIELDVQLSSDGEAVVFHDETLERMTGRAGRVSDHPAHELQTLTLQGTSETIPTLAEVLALVGRHSLIQIELKTPPGAVGPLERRVHDIIIDHPGPVAVIGFNPYSHAWFADHYPGVMRGLDSYSYQDARHISREQRSQFARLEHVALARPHFLALGLDIVASEPAQRLRGEGYPVVAWTVRSEAQWASAQGACDNLIFEGFTPKARP